MAAPSVTHTFSNSTVADATQVNTNFTDVINGVSDGTKDLSVSAFTAAGAVTLNGAVTLGNATGDDITITGYVASNILPKTSANNDLGSTTQNWQALYLDNGATDGGAIYFDAGTTEFIKSTADGSDLALGGFTGFDLAGAKIKTFAREDVAKSADYTITDTDGVSVIYVTTSTTARTITLPTAADNDGRIITVKKVDSSGRSSGTGNILTLDGEGSETIDGSATYVALGSQYDFVTVQCDGTEWHILNRRSATYDGLKVYNGGSTYNGDTITATGSDSYVHTSSTLIPYQTSDGSWFLRCNMRFGTASVTTCTVTFDLGGATFASTVQAGTGSGSGGFTTFELSSGSAVGTILSDTASTVWRVFFDAELSGKPGWAD